MKGTFGALLVVVCVAMFVNFVELAKAETEVEWAEDDITVGIEDGKDRCPVCGSRERGTYEEEEIIILQDWIVHICAECGNVYAVNTGEELE